MKNELQFFISVFFNPPNAQSKSQGEAILQCFALIALQEKIPIKISEKMKGILMFYREPVFDCAQNMNSGGGKEVKVR